MQHDMRQVLTSSASVQYSFVYTAFGDEVFKSTGTANAPFFRHHGEMGVYRDFEDTNLARNRFSDADKGQWINRDPSGSRGGHNRYKYLENNAVNYVDPMGTQTLVIPSGGDLDAGLMTLLPDLAAATWNTWLNHHDPGSPGFAESLIPVWGSGREALHDFATDHPYWGTLNTALAVSDVLLVKAFYEDLAKVGWKGMVKLSGSHEWKAIRKWLNDVHASDFKYQQFHHWLVSRRNMRLIIRAITNQVGFQHYREVKEVIEFIFNQRWNLKALGTKEATELASRQASQGLHSMIHGNKSNYFRGGRFGPVRRAWEGTPDWAKQVGSTEVGKTVNRVHRTMQPTPPGANNNSQIEIDIRGYLTPSF